MSPEVRMIALERELADTGRAAVVMMRGIAQTPDGREELAQGFEDAAAVADPVAARQARLVAEAVRRG